MGISSTSFRTDQEILSALDAIAKDMGRSRNWVINKAVSDFIDSQKWYREQVMKGIEAADNKEFASDQEMGELFKRFGA